MSAFLVLLLNLLVLSSPAYASGAGSGLPIEAAPTVGGATQSGNSAVQPAVAPVTKAIAQTVEQTTAPVGEAGSKDLRTVTAPVSSAVTQSASTVATPVLDTTTQTVHKTAAPVLETAAKTIGETAAPVVETVKQSVDKAAAPILKTAAPALDTTERTLVKAAPVLQRATHTIGDVAAPGGEATNYKSPSKPPTAGAHYLSNAPFSTVTNTTPSTTAPSSSAPLSGFMPAPHAPQGVSTSVIEPASALPGQLAQIMSLMEPLATFATAHTGSYGRQAGTPASTSVLPEPTPSPLPGGSSGAMASAAGVAFSIFLTLVGFLLMGSIAAMRLLRLASKPWHMAPFVLIPERPG